MIRRHLLFLFIVFFSITLSGQSSYEAFSIGFYNLENLFDTLNQENVIDGEFTPDGQNAWTTKKYEHKLRNMATVISELGTDMSSDGVACLGVSEVENIGVLEDLVKEKAIVERNYQIVHYDSPDRRGIDVALLYNPNLFTPEYSKPYPLKLYSRDTIRKFTRDVLLVKGKLQGEEIHILVNHWPSRSGGEKRSAPFRKAAAELNVMITDSIFSSNSEAKIFIMGDLNDDPASPSLKKILKAKKKKEQVSNKGFFNPMYAKYQKGEGSNAWRDSWSLFDQIIVSEPLLDKKQEGLFFHKAEIYKKPEMLQKTGQYKGYPFRTFSGGQFTGGYSDHFPVVAYLLRKV